VKNEKRRVAGVQRMTCFNSGNKSCKKASILPGKCYPTGEMNIIVQPAAGSDKPFPMAGPTSIPPNGRLNGSHIYAKPDIIRIVVFTLNWAYTASSALYPAGLAGKAVYIKQQSSRWTSKKNPRSAVSPK